MNHTNTSVLNSPFFEYQRSANIDILPMRKASSPSSITSSAGTEYGELLSDLWQTTTSSSSSSGTSLSTNYDLGYGTNWSSYESSLLPNTLYNDLDNIDFFPPVAEDSPLSTGNKITASPKQHYRKKYDKALAVNTQLYKTEMCASYQKMGMCPYGSKCQFAHGENELKSVERPPKWRSKPCANWTKYGSCRYGNRCCFKHG